MQPNRATRRRRARLLFELAALAFFACLGLAQPQFAEQEMAARTGVPAAAPADAAPLAVRAHPHRKDLS